MRLAGICLAILLIAACPPRRARIVYVQSCPVPCTPVVYAPVVAAPVVPPIPPAKPSDPKLDAHLIEWEKRAASTNNLRTEIVLTRTDAVFKKTTTFTGVALCMKPNLAVLRLDNSGDPTKTDYEAYICDGKTAYFYSGVTKTVTEIKLPAPWPFQQIATPIFPLELLLGAKAQEMKERFDITLFKTDENYIYLDLKPRSEKEREFKHLRLALYGPGANTAKFAYLPAQVYALKPNGDTEVWKFSNPQVDLPGVDAKSFQYVEIKDPKWRVQKSPWGEGEVIRPAKP